MPPRVLSALVFTSLLTLSAGPAKAADQCPVLPTGHATLNGSVKAADGGANVLSTVTAAAEFAGYGPYFVVGVTDFFAGTFSLEVPAPGTYVVSASPLDQQHAPEFYDGVLTKAAATTFTVSDGEVVNGIDFTVVQGTTLSGTVTAQGSGDPISNVTVAVTALGDVPTVNGDKTDASGNYTVSGLAPGQYQVVFHPGSGDFVREVYNDHGKLPGDPVDVPESGVTGIDAALAIGGRIEGTITGNGNLPINGAAVSAQSDFYGFGGAVTDASGNYSILVPEGTHKVLALTTFNYLVGYYDGKPDLASADPVNVTSGATTSGIDIHLTASGHITGTVTDADTHQPIEGATIVAYDTNDVPTAAAVSGPTGAYNLGANLATGQYRVGFQGPGLAFDGLPAYVPAFYSNKSTLPTATHVSVTAPNTTPNINQALSRCTGGVVTTTTLGATTTTSQGATTTSLSVTTSTTSLPVTTTTIPGQLVCGDPAAPIGAALGIESSAAIEPGGGELPRAITASDALYILRTAVGSQTCALCVCDVNDSNSITATDALTVLRRAVGQPVELACPAC